MTKGVDRGLTLCGDHGEGAVDDIVGEHESLVAIRREYRMS